MRNGLMLCFLTVSAATAQELTIVVPNDRIDVEGDDSAPDDFAGTAFHVQFIYEASQFASLPETHGPITGFVLRPDAAVTSPRDLVYDDIELRLSTTERTPDDLDTFFADNVGADEVLVFDGELEVATQAAGPPGGPREFDYVYRFTESFDYDPSRGNLLLDVVTFSGQDFSQQEDQDSGVFGVFVDDPEGEFGELLNAGIVTQFVFESAGVPGDFDGNGILDAVDIDLLSIEAESGNNRPEFDLNGDALVDQTDRVVWVHDLKSTYFGDSNLDGEFNSGDLVEVFTAGEYEDGIAQNSGWSTGDWNGDRDFTSGDIVSAFTDGGYETGPRAASVVPEPSATWLLLLGIMYAGWRRRKSG